MKFDRQAFWKNPGAPANIDAYTEAVISHCRPEFYLDLVNVTRLVVETVKKYATPNMSVLELGCGTGRNLVGLVKAGFKEVYGLELNKNSVKLGEANFPEMSDVHIKIGAVEDVIKGFPEADVIFTQGLLMHLPPELEWVISEMANKSRHLIFTIEGERPPSFHAWPHDYKKIIEAGGVWRQFEARTCEAYDPLPKTTVIRVFMRINPLPAPVVFEAVEDGPMVVTYPEPAQTEPTPIPQHVPVQIKKAPKKKV